MNERAFFVGAHEFRFTAPKTSQGAWTAAIVHVDHSRKPPAESYFATDTAYTRESEALSYAEELAHELARHLE